MSEHVRPGVTKEFVDLHQRLIGSYDIDGLVAAADDLGFGWYLGNASWDESHVEHLTALQCCVVVLRWYGDEPSDEDGYHFDGVGFHDPTEALRDGMRHALKAVIGWWDEEGGAE